MKGWKKRNMKGEVGGMAGKVERVRQRGEREKGGRERKGIGMLNVKYSYEGKTGGWKGNGKDGDIN